MTQAQPSTSEPSHRLAALDWMRGFVMVLMAVDHASAMWNAGRVAADSAYLLDPTTGGPAWTTDCVNGDHFGGSSSTPAAVAGYPNITVPAGPVW